LIFGADVNKFEESRTNILADKMTTNVDMFGMFVAKYDA